MKKVSLIVGILLISAGTFAQHAPLFGLKGGVNLANWNSESNEETNLRTGVHLGGLAHIHITPQWALQPELQYSSQGTETSIFIDDLGETNDFTWKLDYINIPVMVQYMFNNGFRLEAGPQVGLLMDAKLKNKTQDLSQESNDDFKKVDFSLGVGLSYLTYSGLGLGVRYNHGLTDINDNRTFETKNRVFQIGVFYMFDSRHKSKSR